MKLTHTRRLTGPNRWTQYAASVGEVDCQGRSDLGSWLAHWSTCMRQAAAQVGWHHIETFWSHKGDLLMLGIYPPLDGLYMGCDLVEWCVEAMLPYLDTPPETYPSLSKEESERFRRAAEREHQALLHPLLAEAERRGIPWLFDDDLFSLGLGRHTQQWALPQLPEADQLAHLPWDTYQSIPLAMITGTNGKTTTSRLLTRIARSAGHSVGNTSTDGLSINEQEIESGDWTGPGGSRQILRHKEIDFAVLETARGGMLRRGIVCPWAEVAIVTNVSNDHLGEWGIETVEQMAEVKLLVRHGLRPGGSLLLNADCSPLVDAAARELPEAPPYHVRWFTLNDSPDAALAHLPQGSVDTWLKDDKLHLRHDGQVHTLDITTMPVTLGGSARHNIQNAQAAALAALQMGVSLEAISKGLGSFRPTSQDSPGRANFFTLDQAHILVDFGHNPDGVKAIAALAQRLAPKGRTLVLLGQAGDRSDEEIRGLAKSALLCQPDIALLKEMEPYLRGRELGEISSILKDVFVEHGYTPEQIHVEQSEQDAIHWALHWKQPGDLLLLFVQANIKWTLQHLKDLGATEGYHSS